MPLDELPDADLAERCRAGQAAAWSTLVRRFQRLIYTVPRRAGLNDELAADVFQATFARLHEHLHRIDDLSRVRAWLVTTARRETLRLIEDMRRLPRAEFVAGSEPGEDADPLADVADPSPLAEDQLAGLQDLAQLRQAVDRLDPRARQFVELLFLQEDALPYAEIALRLGIAEGSIGPTRARVLAKLRALLGG